MVATTNKVAWNTAEQLIMEIGKLRSAANLSYINKNLSKAIRILSAIKMSIVHSLSKDEISFLDKLEAEATKKQIELDKYEGSGFNMIKDKKYYTIRAELDGLYREFNNYLQVSLERYGYLIEKKEDRTVLRF